jgi:hypothetical protein
MTTDPAMTLSSQKDATQRPLSDEETAVFDEWFGPASDGVSVAIRRAIRDGILAAALAAQSSPSLDVERLATALLHSHTEAKWSVQPYGDIVPWSWQQIADAVAAEYARLAAKETPDG